MRKICLFVVVALAACVQGNDSPTAPSGQPVAMDVVLGQNDTASTGTEIGIAVHVLGVGGASEANQLVNWVVTQGSGSLFVAASTSNSSGIASNRFTLGAGDNTVEVRAIDDNGDPITYAVIHAYGTPAPRLVDWVEKWNGVDTTGSISAQMTPGVPYDFGKHLTFQIVDGTTREEIPGATAQIAGILYDPLAPQGGKSCTQAGTTLTCNAAALDGSNIYVIPADPGPGYQWIPYRSSGPVRFVNSAVFLADAAPPPATTFTANFTVLCNSKHTCSFDATSSTIPNGVGTAGSYNWNFGDGYQGTKATIIHDYGTTKTVNVTLKIYDSKLKSASVTKTVITGPIPVVFSSDRGGNLDIYSMNSDGTSQTRLTTNAATDYQPSWSPDHSKIAFVSNRGGVPNIYTMDANGANQTALTSGSTNYVPEWSPDGSKIVFISERDGGGANAREVYIMNANGTNQTRLTSNTAPEGFPAWSPDGTRIVFESARSGANFLYVMNADGNGQTPLISSSASDYQPAFSPDGRKIAWVSDRDGNLEVYVADADGGSEKRLTTNNGADSKPSWSPDGSRIIFTSDRGGTQDIYLMKADGSGVTQLTNNAAADSYGGFPLHQ